MRGRLLAAVALVAVSGTAVAQARTPHHRAVHHRASRVSAQVSTTAPAPPTARMVAPTPMSTTIPTTPMANVVPQGPQQSLREALVRTYATNPTLLAQRQ